MRIIKTNGVYEVTYDDADESYTCRNHQKSMTLAQLKSSIYKLPKKTKQQIRAEKIEALLKGEEEKTQSD